MLLQPPILQLSIFHALFPFHQQFVFPLLSHFSSSKKPWDFLLFISKIYLYKKKWKKTFKTAALDTATKGTLRILILVKIGIIFIWSIIYQEEEQIFEFEEKIIFLQVFRFLFSFNLTLLINKIFTQSNPIFIVESITKSFKKKSQFLRDRSGCCAHICNSNLF